MNLQEDLEQVTASAQSIIQRLITTSYNINDDPIFKVAQPDDLPILKDLSIPGSARPLDQTVEDAFSIFHNRARTNHNRFFAFIPSPVNPVSWLGDLISGAFNSFAGSKIQGSGVAVVEKTLIQWLASKIGMPDTAGGVFVSGGSMANLTAIIVARDQILPSGKEYLGVAYLSDQTHYSVSKALRLVGFKKHHIRIIPSDTSFRMQPDALQESILSDREAGLLPFLVVGTSGTTNIGSVDPLADLSAICKQESIWFHIDGAYGASASLAATRSDSVLGLGLADSISWDAHKWLFQTYACSLVLVKDGKTLADSFGNDGDYLRDAFEDDDIPNFWNFGIELTRPARAMKLWFTLRVLGVERIGQMIDQGFFLAEAAEDELKKLPNWEITSPASLAIVTFRHAPPGMSESALDAVNFAISQKLLADNVAGILTTKLRGMVVLRICSISPYLTVTDMRQVIREVDEVARELIGRTVQQVG